MKLTLNQFNYQLPQELIANEPVSPRDHSRLMVLDRQIGKLDHRHFYELDQILKPSDVLVRNNTKVIMARLIGYKPTGGKVEILLNKPVKFGKWDTWECLTKPGLKENSKLKVQNSKIRMFAICIGMGDDGFTRIVKFDYAGDFFEVIDKLGEVPLPPYIKPTQRKNELKKLYQTQFAKKVGSVAAPTAGLHFTKALDKKLIKKGVQIEEITLHVGMGTFAPVKEKDVTKHKMHSEYFSLDEATADRLNQAKKDGRRIIAVGTTTVRVLESCVNTSSNEHTRSGNFAETTQLVSGSYSANDHHPESASQKSKPAKRHPELVSGSHTTNLRDSESSVLRSDVQNDNSILKPQSGETDIFIYPPYKFKFVDGLITNFHLPHSTLLMLVSAFVTYPNTEEKFRNFNTTLVGKAYKEAVKHHYHFFSFGDAMLIE